MKRFNVKRFIADCGGVRVVAEKLEKTRTAPYRMINKRLMNTQQIERLLDHHPDINLHAYFEDADASSDDNGSNEARP